MLRRESMQNILTCPQTNVDSKVNHSPHIKNAKVKAERERDHNIVVVDMKHRPLTTTLTSLRIVKLQFVNTERATNVTTNGALSRNFSTKGYNFSQAH